MVILFEFLKLLFLFAACCVLAYGLVTLVFRIRAAWRDRDSNSNDLFDDFI